VSDHLAIILKQENVGCNAVKEPLKRMSEPRSSTTTLSPLTVRTFYGHRLADSYFIKLIIL
jgi:hypothetical protein